MEKVFFKVRVSVSSDITNIVLRNIRSNVWNFFNYLHH